MDTEMKIQKSLPPFVEGKIYGYLKLVVDEVIWSARNFGEIHVLLSWWGETSTSHFRPANISKNVIRSQEDTTEIYAICTSINLFEEYIKNCEPIELVIVSDETNLILGTSQIIDLKEIFNYKPYFRYVPIINNTGSKIGEIHISMKFEYMLKSCNMQLKTHRYETKPIDNILVSTIDTLKSQDDLTTDSHGKCRNFKPKANEIYKSILKSRRTEFQDSINKFNNQVTDKLVAQIVARAQKLRGDLLKETYNEDSLSTDYNSINSGIHSDIFIEDNTKLQKLYLDKNITSSNENKMLCALRATSLNPSFVDSTYNSFNVCKRGTADAVPSPRMKCLLDDVFVEKEVHIGSEDSELFNHLNYVRINVESLTLSPAGYRRVKSSSFSGNDNTFLFATYFVQYDVTFDYVSESEKRGGKEGKPIRICSKKQTNEAIYFNYNGTYRISSLQVQENHFIKFKIFVRHYNRKLLIELGSATFYLNDVIRNKSWKITKRLSIISKGIKIGELSIIIELGSDSSHLGKQYVNRIMYAKENIPILETQHVLNETRNKGNKPATETQPKPSNQVSPISVGAITCLTTDSDIVTKNTSHYKSKSRDDRSVDTKNQKNRIEDKVVLHGLIYVAEGQELPEVHTYLICRGFWREDKARSQICYDTKHPLYQFCQLVPVICDNNLLERIKNNYIIIEVYSRNNNEDNLLGLTKLPVHHLYMALKDPHALPSLLSSKYPVVSVDGWVPIIDPVTGQSYGQLLALVALGTSEQISLLEASRGLRNTGVTSQTGYCENFSDHVHTASTREEELYSSRLGTQECQTDISTVKGLKFNNDLNREMSNLEHSSLRNAIHHFEEGLNVNKMNIDQSVQTDISTEEKKQMTAQEHMCINDLNLNNSDDTDYTSLRHTFHLSTETYRSVGVGAEYDEEIYPQPNSINSNTTLEFPIKVDTDYGSTNSVYNQTMFRATVEIECALHLPKVEKVNDTIEPSTYVSFQAIKPDYSKRQNQYMVTDVFAHSCNPKWNWKCNTKLPTELLLHDDKRLIFKIWRMLDTDVSMQINLERDIVIGFSAVDLSILVNGFPTVSGWFHIMDFTGKCNGQIKVCITPLDNLSLLGKSVIKLNSTRVPTCSVSQSNSFPLTVSEMHTVDIERSNSNYNLLPVAQEEQKPMYNENQLNECAMHIGLEDVSMSFLSSSLKKKLTELEEITQRLQSRLRDVTNEAFEDDLENEFDLNEPNSDNENNDYKVAESAIFVTTIDSKNKTCQTTDEANEFLHTAEENRIISSETSTENYTHQQMYSSANETIGCELMGSDTERSKFYGRRKLLNENREEQQQPPHLMQDVIRVDNPFTNYPERGTKTHINYLLDKLSLQFPVQSEIASSVPIKKHVASLLTNFKQSSNNLNNIKDYNQELKMCTVPTQTDEVHEHSIKNSESPVTDYVMSEEAGICESIHFTETGIPSQTGKKMSKVIREELIAEESNDTTKYDELTTYLVTSNIRHMDLNNILNPLLYPHLVPDLYHVSASSEEESVKQLDNQHSRALNTSITNTLNQVHRIAKTKAPLDNEGHFRTPCKALKNNDDSINLTVFHKTSYSDLLANNSTDSTTTISTEKSLIKPVDPELMENCDSTFTETSVLVLSRQAPDGGNPVEDSKKPLVVQQKNESEYSSSNTCN